MELGLAPGESIGSDILLSLLFRGVERSLVRYLVPLDLDLQ